MTGIPLADAIADLREELLKAVQKAKGKAIRFELGTVEMEFEIAVTKEGGANGKAKFLVVELGAQGKVGQTSTHRLKLTLEPKGPDNRHPEIAQDAGEPI